MKQKIKIIIFLVILCLISFFIKRESLAADIPIILYTDITSGPGTGGENNQGSYLTINGNNFGDNQGLSSVTIGGGTVADYKYWSDTKISVQIGPLATDGDILVNTENGSANAPDQFDVRSGDLFFISISGIDAGSTCSYLAPCRTANYVEQLSNWGAGDFLIIRGGTYDISSGNENLSNNAWLNIGRNSIGTVTNRYTVYGYPGETATISWGDDTSIDNRGVRCMWEADYWVISNLVFDLRDSGGVGLYLGFYSDPTAYFNHARIINVKITGGMAGSDYGVNSLSLQRVDYLKIYGLDIGDQSILANPSLESHMIYMSHFYQDAEIAYSYIHDNTYGRTAFQVAGDSWGGNPVWGNNSNIRIHHNIFKNLPESAILFNLGSFGPVYFYNNIINNVCTTHPAGFSPIAIRGAADSEIPNGEYYIYNNTIYTEATDYNPGGIFQFGYNVGGGDNNPEQIYLRNNIVYAKTSDTNYYQINNVAFDTMSQLTASNNLWYGSSDSVPVWDINYQTGDPHFVSLGSDFSLQAGSLGINLGADTSSILTTDFSNKIRSMPYDIGAFEYSSGDTTAPSSPSGLGVL